MRLLKRLGMIFSKRDRIGERERVVVVFKHNEVVVVVSKEVEGVEVNEEGTKEVVIRGVEEEEVKIC
jgi:hypothetical protein